MIPICLITGFLGTGKTTLLKRIAAENRHRKWIYLVNEFSALDVDGAIVSDENPNVVSIPGGSIFCKCLVTEFIGQMKRITETHPETEGLVIEASGMADPRVIADMLKETGLDQQYELNNIISIVEPRSFLRLIHTLPNISRQIEAAHQVLLNKCDLYDETALAENEAAVRRINPDVTIHRCVQGQADIPLFGKAMDSDQLHGEYAACRDPRYAAFSSTFPFPVAEAALRKLILENESSVYRVKGYIESLDGPVYFDYSKAGFSCVPAEPGHRLGLAWIVKGDSDMETQISAFKSGQTA